MWYLQTKHLLSDFDIHLHYMFDFVGKHDLSFNIFSCKWYATIACKFAVIPEYFRSSLSSQLSNILTENVESLSSVLDTEILIYGMQIWCNTRNVLSSQRLPHRCDSTTILRVSFSGAMNAVSTTGQCWIFVIKFSKIYNNQDFVMLFFLISEKNKKHLENADTSTSVTFDMWSWPSNKVKTA